MGKHKFGRHSSRTTLMECIIEGLICLLFLVHDVPQQGVHSNLVYIRSKHKSGKRREGIYNPDADRVTPVEYVIVSSRVRT